MAVLGSMPTRGSDYLVRQPLNRISLSVLIPWLYHAPRKKGRWESSREDKVTRAKIRGGRSGKRYENGRMEHKVGRESNRAKMGEQERELSNSKTGARIKGRKQATTRTI